MKIALINVIKLWHDATALRDAKNLSPDIINSEFLFGLIVWYNILSTISRLRKMLKNKNMPIGSIVSWKHLFHFLKHIEKLDLNLTKLLLKKLFFKWMLNLYFLKIVLFIETNTLVKMPMMK